MSHLYRRGQVFWLKWYQDGKAYRQSLKTKDKTVAKALKNEKELELAKGTAMLPRPDASSREVLEEYLAATKHRRIPRVIEEDRAKIERFLDWSKCLKLKQVREKPVQDYINHRIKADKLSLNTANHIITALKTYLNFAVKRGYLAKNPIAYLQKYRLTSNPPRFLTDDECKKLLVIAKDSHIYPMIVTALYTGMRLGELKNLEWQDINFQENTLTVLNKEQFTTKSKKFRIIPLHKVARETLWPLRKASGHCFDLHNLRKTFEKIIKDAKLTGVGWHSLRHTTASYLAMKGIDLPTIAQILGHADIKTTMIYAHLTKGHVQNAIDKLNF